jgi:hypothetical protein
LSELEYRLRRLERRLVVWQPSGEEYLDASNRERIRALHVLTERLAPHGFDGDHLFTEESRRMLAEDTPERRRWDRETIDAWRKAQGINPEMGTEGAKEKLLAKLEARSGK